MSLNTLPANLPEAPDAKLPLAYEAAQKALAECTDVDECWTWKNKAAALESYARQARDNTLREYALRIQARAIHRAGELLRQIAPAQGGDRGGPTGGRPPVGESRKAAADAAGLSEHQRKTALRVANVPRDELDAALESDHPPTITELAARGTVSRPSAPETAPTPADPRQVAEATALLRQLAAFCETHDPVSIATASAMDVDLWRNDVSTIERWLDRFITNLPEERAA